MSEEDEVIEEAIQAALRRMEPSGDAYYDEEIGDWRLRDTERFKREVRAEALAIMRRKAEENTVRAEVITFGNRGFWEWHRERTREEESEEEQGE
jgi:hypothetical protein